MKTGSILTQSESVDPGLSCVGHLFLFLNTTREDEEVVLETGLLSLTVQIPDTSRSQSKSHSVVGLFFGPGVEWRTYRVDNLLDGLYWFLVFSLLLSFIQL